MVKKKIKVDFQNNLIEALLKCRKNWLKKLEFITNRIYRCHAVVCCREPDAFEFVADVCTSKFSPANDLPAGLVVRALGSGSRGPKFKSCPGQELSLVDRSCISMMCYAASTTVVTPT
jgi:hypothetical protein